MWFMHGGQLILLKFECLVLRKLIALVRIRKSKRSHKLTDEMEWLLLQKMTKMVVDDG